MTSSVGTSTSSIWSPRPASATACLICSATFFSKFERTLTEYHRFAMAFPFLVPVPGGPMSSILAGRLTRAFARQ